jgi:hypothetical protein
VRPVLRLAVAIAGACACAAPATALDVPPAVSLDGGWTLQLPGGTPRPVTLPQALDPRPLPQLFGGETGTYRLTLTPPPLPAGFQWALRFEQVRRTARVSVDGKLLGVHTDPYVAFTLPAPELRPGRASTIEVVADSHKPDAMREGWWNWGGILRPVTLVPEGPVVLHDPGLVPELHCRPPGVCGAADVRVDGVLENRTPRPQAPALTVRLKSPHGGPATVQTSPGPTLAPGASARVRFTVPIEGTADLWSPDHPALYDASIDTSVGSALAQRDRMRIGLRQVTVRNGHLLVNGRRLELRGASIQEDLPGRGAALRDSDIDEIVRELHAVHANITRAHYLLDQRLLSRLDAAGILVWTQAPVYHRDRFLRTPAQRAQALETLRRTVLGARSHPSTLAYSVANELTPRPDDSPAVRSYLDAAPGVVRDADPTLPVAVDILTYPGLPYQRTFSAFDALGINDYYGWYRGKSLHSTANLGDLDPYLRTTHARYPRAALVVTEYGAEATQNGPASQKQTYAFQSAYLRKTLGIVRRTGFVDGTIYWTLREFAVKPFWDGLASRPRPGIAVDAIHNKGLIAYGGQPKPAFAVASSLFGAIPLHGLQAPAPPAPDKPGERLLLAGSLLALLALGVFDLWCFAGLRRRRAQAAPARRRAPALAPVPLRGEADGDHVAVAHDVVAAFEA